MSTRLTDELADLTIQQVSRRTGLAESALRYYERIGLIEPVPRDQSSGHRRYPSDLVAAIEALSCLRGTGMSVADMRAYVANMQRGHGGEAEQRDLFARHAERLGDEIARLKLREQYVATKAELWAAKERGDAAAEERIIPKVRQLSARLLAEEAGPQHD
jgi:DNA-binding transcriptional MerR regulator